MATKGTKGIARLINATRFSLQGLKAAFQNEEAFRQEVYLSLFLIPIGLCFGNSGIERAMLISALLIVMVTELVNSGLEAVVDRLGGEIHELSGRAKDIGSAAVLIALVNAVIVWVLILIY